MEHIQNQMNLDEHCTECGAMLVDVGAALVCPHCGYEIHSSEDLPFAFIAPIEMNKAEVEQTQQAA